MNHLGLVLLLLASCFNLLVSLLVLYRNYRRPANIAFAVTSFSLSSWAALNFFSTSVDNRYTLLVTRLTGFFGVWLIASFFALSSVFPNKLKRGKWFVTSLTVITLIVAALCLTSLFIKTGYRSTKGLQLSEGAIYPLYPLYILSMFVLCNVNFVRQYRLARNFAKNQIKLMWLGIFMTVGLIVLSNVILPAVTSSWSTSKLGTLFTTPFVVITAYAIVRKRMFDVRLIISRTIAYALTIGLVAVLYSLAAVLLAAHLAASGNIKHSELGVLVIAALLIALTFNSLQAGIAKLTNRVFYRDAYDLRDVLERLSDALLADSDVDQLMQDSLILLAEALKPTSAYLAVLNTSGVIYKHAQVGDHVVNDVTPFLLRLTREREALIDSNQDTNRPIIRLMNENNVELMLRIGNKSAPIGILLLSAKRNGSMYTMQDMSLLEIGAKNLGIALDNARKYEQISNFAATLHKGIKRATAKLRHANEELKTLDRLKDDFISTASHQLRSPAVSVHDALHMLNYPNVTKKDKDELLVLAEGSSERLVTVVHTMLNMARIQAGHFTIDTSVADMVELVEDELSQVKVLADQKSITLKFDPPKQPIRTRMDVAKVKEAVANYVENAIKYSLEKTTITLTLGEHDGKIQFEVADQGMGVPAQERANLFGRFYRASNARVEQPDGNGIGLYVVKTIAEGHGGEAYYRPGVSTGSVFGFWIKQVAA